MTTKSFVLAALLLAMALASPHRAAATDASFTENFASLVLVDGTLTTKPGLICPFTTSKAGPDVDAACGKAFTVHWANETTNEDGLREVELLQSGGTFSSLCLDGAGTTGGKGDAWFAFSADASTSLNVQLKVDESTGTVLLDGYELIAGTPVAACSAVYMISEDDGLETLLFDDLAAV